jgi:predicted Zn-dependent peptidase
MKAVQEVLTPTHPYGTQTTLGRSEDLKNPSQTNIYRFFDRYYVPNNMAMVLCGDFDPQAAVALAERHFGHFQPKPLPPFQVENSPPSPPAPSATCMATRLPGWKWLGSSPVPNRQKRNCCR